MSIAGRFLQGGKPMQIVRSQLRSCSFKGALHSGVALLWLFGLVAAGLGQTPSAAIGGAVTDTTGASIPNAKVTIDNVETGLDRVVLTTIEGRYHVAALPAGKYRVVVEAPGFRVVDARVTVETGATTPFNPRMELGATTE